VAIPIKARMGTTTIVTASPTLIPSIIFSMHKIKEQVNGHWVSVDNGTKKMWIEGT